MKQAMDAWKNAIIPLSLHNLNIHHKATVLKNFVVRSEQSDRL